MKQVLITAVIASLLAVSLSPLHATERYHGSTVKWVYPAANGDFAVGLDTNSPECPSPNSPTKYMHVSVGQNGVTAEGAKKLYAAAVLALATARRIDLVFDDGTPACYVNRFSVTN